MQRQFRRLILALIATVFPAVAWAQLGVVTAPMRPLGFCQYTVSTAALVSASCTGGIPVGAALAIIIDETANTRWRDDGTAPTTSAGMLLTSTAGLSTLVYTGDLTKLQFVAVTGSPVLDISFYATR